MSISILPVFKALLTSLSSRKPSEITVVCNVYPFLGASHTVPGLLICSMSPLTVLTCLFARGLLRAVPWCFLVPFLSRGLLTTILPGGAPHLVPLLGLNVHTPEAT